MAIPYDPRLETNPFRAREREAPATPEPKRPARARQAKARAAPGITLPVVKEEGEDVVTARQIRAGRALLNWSQKQLAEAADVSRATLMRIEADAPDTKASTLKAIADALRKEGVRLYDDSDGIGEGARMAKPDAAE